MRVVLIAPEFIPNWGGIGTYCIELARYLSVQNDIELHVVAPLRRMGSIEYSRSKILGYFSERIHVHLLGSADETFLYNAGFQLNIWRYLPQILKEQRIELIHSQHAHMSDILFQLSASHHVPSITTVHSTVRNQYEGIRATHQSWSEMDASEKYELLLYPWLRVAEEFYLRRSDNLIPVSEWTRDYIRTNYSLESRTSQVIYNGVDTERFRPLTSSDIPFLEKIAEPIILYASRLTVARGAHLLARAIPLILSENRKVHFVFAGAGNIEGLHETLRSCRVPRENYTLLGYVDYDDLPALYRSAYAFIMPSSWENLPFKLLEAMSSGVPVVTTNVGGIPEVVQNGINGLFTSRNENDLAQRIVELLEDEALSKRLGRNARNTVQEKFNWNKTATQTKKVYEHTLAQDHSYSKFDKS
jgi:glycosyltransferase involved in cell wall biosynthesis